MEHVTMEEVEIYVSHLSNISSLIFNHDNDELIRFLDDHMILNEGVISTRSYEVLFSNACDSGNYASLYLLRDYGFNIANIHWSDMYAEEEENWIKSPLAVAFRTSNMELVVILLELGFTASCGQCINMCCHDTCILYETFADKMNIVGVHCLEKMIRYTNPSAVISAFQRYVNIHDCRDAHTIFDVICRSIPSVNLDVWVTRDNHQFVMGLVNNGFIDVDILLSSTVNLLLGSPIFNLFTGERRFDFLNTNELVTIIKKLIDLGVDIDKNMDIRFSYVHQELSGNLDGMNSSGSLVDVIKSIISHEETGVDCPTCRSENPIIMDMFSDLQDLYRYIKCKQRLGFISRRVRKMDSPNKSFAEKVIVDVNSSIFSEIMKYIVF